MRRSLHSLRNIGRTVVKGKGKRNLERASTTDEDNEVPMYATLALERMDRGEGSLKNYEEFGTLHHGLCALHGAIGYSRLMQLAKVLDGTKFAEFPSDTTSGWGYESKESLNKRLIPELCETGLGEMADAEERMLKRPSR